MTSLQTGLAPWHVPRNWAVDFTEFSGNLELKGNVMQPPGAVPVGGLHFQFTCKLGISKKDHERVLNCIQLQSPVLKPAVALRQLHKAATERN